MADSDATRDSMSFLDHLQELRVRLSWSALALVAGFLLCWPFAKPIFGYLAQPVNRYLAPGETLAFTRLTEPFFVYMKVAALAGIFVASPLILLQFWLFVSPALYRNEKKYAIPFVLASTGFFLLGATFAFKILFPSICSFFLAQGKPYRMVVTLDQYFSMLFWTVLGVAMTFELPVIVGLLARLGLVSGQFLARHWQAALIACLVLSAVVTPTPDAMTMLFVAVPMMALYLFSIVVARILQPTGSGS